MMNVVLSNLLFYFSSMEPLDTASSSDLVMTNATTLWDLNSSPIVDLLTSGIGTFYIAIGIFLLYCQYVLSKKMNIPNSWLAFIPVVNLYNLTQIAGLSFWWIIGLFIPLWNIYATIKIYHGVSKRTNHGGWWTVGLIFFYWIMLPITAFTYRPVVQNTDGSLSQD